MTRKHLPPATRTVSLALGARVKRFRTWLSWQRVPASLVRIERPSFEARLSAAYAVFYVGAAFLTGWLIVSHPHRIFGATDFLQDAWYALFFKIGLLLVVPLAAYLRLGYRVAELAPGWRLSAGTGATLALSFAAGFCLNLGHIPKIASAVSSMPAPEAWGRIAVGLLLPLLVAGLPEELFFRGILQTRLERVLGRWPAIVATVLLFTAWHLPTRYMLAHGVEGQAGDWGSVLVGTGLPVLIVGLVFGLLWDRYRSLYPLVAAHWGIDVLPAISSMVGVSF